MSEREPYPDLLAQAHALPKVLLHEHLDGGLRVATLLELLRERGITPPAPDADLSDAARARLRGSLLRYDAPFEPVIAPDEWEMNRDMNR